MASVTGGWARIPRLRWWTLRETRLAGRRGAGTGARFADESRATQVSATLHRACGVPVLRGDVALPFYNNAARFLRLTEAQIAGHHGPTARRLRGTQFPALCEHTAGGLTSRS